MTANTPDRTFDPSALARIRGSWVNAVGGDINALDRVNANGFNPIVRDKVFKSEKRLLVRLYDKSILGDGATNPRIVKYAWEPVEAVRLFEDEEITWETTDGRPTSTGLESIFDAFALNRSEMGLYLERHTGIPLHDFQWLPTVELKTLTISDGEQLLVFDRPLDQYFSVKVFQVGGSAGSLTTPCTFTYRIEDFDGNPLANSDPTTIPPGVPKTPIRKRTAFGGYEPGGPEGVARWNWETGKIELWDANEVELVADCPEGAAAQGPDPLLERVHELEKRVELLTTLVEVNR